MPQSQTYDPHETTNRLAFDVLNTELLDALMGSLPEGIPANDMAEIEAGFEDFASDMSNAIRKYIRSICLHAFIKREDFVIDNLDGHSMSICSFLNWPGFVDIGSNGSYINVKMDLPRTHEDGIWRQLFPLS